MPRRWRVVELGERSGAFPSRWGEAHCPLSVPVVQIQPGRGMGIISAPLSTSPISPWLLLLFARDLPLRCGVWEQLKQPSAASSPWPNVLSARLQFWHEQRHSLSGVLVAHSRMVSGVITSLGCNYTSDQVRKIPANEKLLLRSAVYFGFPHWDTHSGYLSLPYSPT